MTDQTENLSRRERRNRARTVIDTSIVWQMRIYLVLALIFLVLFVRHIVLGDISLWAAALSLIAGYAIGAVLVRGQHLSWDTDARQIAKSSTVIGTALLVVYILFAIFKDEVLHRMLGISNPALLGAIGSGISAGVMIGRVLRTRRGIVAVLSAIAPHADMAPPQEQPDRTA